ncbi:TPA: prepilin-type N-terminal cleavage/methylation domain-containing protein [Vibrio vulnificus]|nr:prepilin-type N-terminal cleavage/methylation domain-containing protein [Vibrio vulnificus]HAS8519837.1 prepilin-type N-terminal cleavage/methylation domain-containing protein [Vibrio vulnificus]
MNRGFTLIELLLTIGILSILLAYAVPSFSSLLKSSRVNTTQDELLGFSSLARSEAVFRNVPIFIHFRELSNANIEERCVVLSLSNTISDCATDVLYVLNGRVFEGLTLEHVYPENVIKIDRVNGRPLLDHSTFDSEGYSEVLKFFAENSKKISMKMHITGRVSFCGVDGDWYRTKSC